ncbi:cytochrome P450 family protein [Longirhabdus pacifica]|uniref:cytochrome P450 family protein n=1 Tax=Longirhabdus pacifica TaxID=2305227 RepID=UPI001008FE0D|nr:cytochrome P450 [Longirhabdus pacifica]
MLHPNPLHHFDLSSPSFAKNPHPYYDYLRKNKPIIKVDVPGGDPTWLVTRYDDVQFILKNTELLSKHRSSVCPYHNEQIPKPLKAFNKSMLNVDPPDHTRLRKLIAKAFAPKSVEPLKPRMYEIANDLIDRMMTKENPDLNRDFCIPFPFTVNCEMLGISKEKQAEFGINWSNALVQSLGNQTTYLGIERDMNSFLEYVDELIASRRNNLEDDIISLLIAAYEDEDEDKITEEELQGTIIMLMTGGYEPTANAISNSMFTLLNHPDQLAMWKEDPSVRSSAVEEIIRYCPPFKTIVGRWAKQDFEYLGEQIKMGDAIFSSVESANRDEKYFDSPNRLDITRKNNKHLSFGEGIHYCIAAYLSKLETLVSLEALVDRLPNLTTTKPLYDLEWAPGIPQRVLNEFPVKW